MLSLKMEEQLIKTEQQNRINSIIKILEHYESEETVVFKILGITITQEVLTVAAGLGASSLLAIVSEILANIGRATPVFMCHGMIDADVSEVGAVELDTEGLLF